MSDRLQQKEQVAVNTPLSGLHPSGRNSRTYKEEEDDHQRQVFFARTVYGDNRNVIFKLTAAFCNIFILFILTSEGVLRTRLFNKMALLFFSLDIYFPKYGLLFKGRQFIVPNIVVSFFLNVFNREENILLTF